MAMRQTTVEFLLPETVTIDNGKMVVLSGSLTKYEVGDRGSGAFPVQNATVFDRNGGAPQRLQSRFIPPSGTPLTAATRLQTVTGVDRYGPGYRQFKATVN
jgi:hypothetical protein